MKQMPRILVRAVGVLLLVGWSVNCSDARSSAAAEDTGLGEEVGPDEDVGCADSGIDLAESPDPADWDNAEEGIDHVADHDAFFAEDGPDAATVETDGDVPWDGWSDASAPCDPEVGPVPFVPTSEYLELCMRQECCGDKYWDPSPVEMSPYQIEWTLSAAGPLPNCIAGEEGLLVVRANWRDLLADPPVEFLCPEAPCGGQCFPSGGKVYLVDTKTDRVKYLGDENPGSWGPANPGEPILGGWKIEVSPEKTYVFHATTPTYGSCGDVPCALPWAVCFLEVKGEKCLHFPLVTPTGDCPLTILDQAQFTDPALRSIPGQCGVW